MDAILVLALVATAGSYLAYRAAGYFRKRKTAACGACACSTASCEAKP